MTIRRKNHGTQTKVKVVLEVLRGEKTTAEITEIWHLHMLFPAQLYPQLKPLLLLLPYQSAGQDFRKYHPHAVQPFDPSDRNVGAEFPLYDNGFSPWRPARKKSYGEHSRR